MTLELGTSFTNFLGALVALNRLEIAILNLQGEILFPDNIRQDTSLYQQLQAFSSKVTTDGKFTQHTSGPNGPVLGMPIRSAHGVVGSILAWPTPAEPNVRENAKLSSPTFPGPENAKRILTTLAELAEDQITNRAESEQMAKELSQSFEDLYLYSRIESQGRSLNFSEAMLKDILEELMATMRADMAFTVLPKSKTHESILCDTSFANHIPNMEEFVADLVKSIPLDAPSLEEGYFIINDSHSSEQFKALHSAPYRFLAVSIQKDNEFFGWLCMVSFNLKEIFRRSEFWLLKSLASSTAAAFENSRLYAESLKIAERECLIRNIFQKYVPAAVANEILKRGEHDLIKLGEKRLLTLLNVDIRKYSQMSKRIPAENMVQVLNFFFAVMGSAVLNQEGIVDKYLGDGLLAIFGAPATRPNPAVDACLAALEMVEKLKEVNEFAHQRYGIILKIGVSINTGEAIVGNIGFEKKMDYTVIGDVVNDTFRLQDLTREKDNAIFISESTCQRVKSHIQIRSLGARYLEKNENQMTVYEVTGKNGP